MLWVDYNNGRHANRYNRLMNMTTKSIWFRENFIRFEEWGEKPVNHTWVRCHSRHASYCYGCWIGVFIFIFIENNFIRLSVSIFSSNLNFSMMLFYHFYRYETHTFPVLYLSSGSTGRFLFTVLCLCVTGAQQVIWLIDRIAV